MPDNRKPLGLTMGDAAGIGPELIVRLFAQGLPWPAVVYGDLATIQRSIRLLNLNERLNAEMLAHAEAPLRPGTIGVLDRWGQLPENLPYGQVNALAGQAAYEYLNHAIDDAIAGRLRALVTAPLNKAAMHAAGLEFPGHTEILAQRSGTSNYAMMLANEELRVLLVTIHMPLAEVPRIINQAQQLRAIHLAQRACRQVGIRSPRIAVAGLNPHAGEGGAFGNEETLHITPAIEQARSEGFDVSGPWPGDTIFMRARRGEFDIVVAQYHDQGLIPIKYMGLEEGVNVTVGLPFIRTSVDHGTAYDIAGKGVADAGSMFAAVRLALRMTDADDV